MVKYTVAASVALVQMAMFARTSVALPMEQQRRDLSDLDARDWKEFVKRYINDELDRREDIVSMAKALQSKGQQIHAVFSSTPHPPPADPQQNRRDLSDLYERGWDEYEKRSFNDIEERDWNEFQERDWDDDEMEARGLDFDELDELD